MRPNETLSEVCEEFSPRFTGAFRRSGLTRFAWPRPKRPIDGVRLDIVIAVIDVATLDLSDDLPYELWFAPPKFRDVYLVFRELWGQQISTRAEDPKVMVSDIVTDLQKIFDKRGEDEKLPRAKWDTASRSTVTHGMSFLQEIDLVRAHPSEQGWIDGGKQLRIADVLKPARSEEKRSAQAVGSEADVAHDSRETHDSRASYTGGSGMFGNKRHIWVPVVKEDGAYALFDTRAEQNVYTDGKLEKIRYEGRTKRTTEDAVRCELVSVEDSGRHRYATVKVSTLEGKKQVTVRVLGDWQLEGRQSDAAELSAVLA